MMTRKSTMKAMADMSFFSKFSLWKQKTSQKRPYLAKISFFFKNMLSLLDLSYSVSTLTITYYVIRMGWFFSVLPVSVDDSGTDSLVICSSVVCRGSSCTGWRCSGLKFSWLWSFLTRQGKFFRLLFVCNYFCRGKKSYASTFEFKRISFRFLVMTNYNLLTCENC